MAHRVASCHPGVKKDIALTDERVKSIFAGFTLKQEEKDDVSTLLENAFP